MRTFAPMTAIALLMLSGTIVRAQEGLVNCETFSSGFTTPDGCIDGSQPSSGPIPSDESVVDDGFGDWPFGWYGPGAGMDF